MYTGIWYDRKQNEIHLWDDKLGYRVFKYKPYCYVQDSEGQYTTIFGDRVRKATFLTPKELNDFKESWSDVVYESDVRPEMRTLVDLYHSFKPVLAPINVAFIDIEVDIDDPMFQARGGGFPKPEEALAPINAITMYLTQDEKYILWCLRQPEFEHASPAWFKNNDYELDVEVREFEDERELLMDFATTFGHSSIRLYSGWNSEKFDVPYIFNRIVGMLGRQHLARLSEIGQFKYDPEREEFRIAGSAHLDYMELYKRFVPNEKDSYKLDTIAQEEIGSNKVKYTGPLGALYREDYRRFLVYNVGDVKLLVDLDRKLKYLDLARTLAHKGNIPYESVVYTTMPIDGAILSYLKQKNLVAPDCKHGTRNGHIQGAYVAEPTPGLYDYVVDFDFTSLYPSIMRTLNISIETVVKKYRDNEIALLEGIDENHAVSANGVVYDLTTRGILPSLLDIWFTERVEFKKAMKDAKIKASQYPEGSEDRLRYEREAEYYNQLQYTTKILLNSVYGACALPSFRFFDRDNAEAVTTTGQLAIKFARKMTDTFMKDVVGVDDRVIYCDTDSLFIPLKSILTKLKRDLNNQDECVKAILETIVPAISAYHSQILDKFAKEQLHVINQPHYFHLKQELIARRMFFIDVKKRYGMWVINEEGVPCDKIEFKGLDIRRSSYPPFFKKVMYDVCQAILKGKSTQEVEDIIRQARKDVKKQPLIDVATPTGISQLKPEGTKGLPAHVKAAHAYNKLIQNEKHVFPITAGAKIKWVYLITQSENDSPVMAFMEDTPQEIIDSIQLRVDYDRIVEMNIDNKLGNILQFCGYKLPEKIDEGFEGFFTI